MRVTRWATRGILMGAVVLAGCNKDAGARKAVVTETAGGTVSSSMSAADSAVNAYDRLYPDDTAEKRGQALVRSINAVPSSEGMVVRADEVRMLPAVGFKQVSAYQSIDGIWVKFEVRGLAKDMYEPLETNRELLSDGRRYSMVVMRDEKGGRYDTHIFRDDISSDGTRAQLRVIHAARGVNAVDVAPNLGGRIFEGVTFNSQAGFLALEPWKGTLEFRNAGGTTVLHAIEGLTLEAGKSYTVVLTTDRKGAVTSFWFDDTQM